MSVKRLSGDNSPHRRDVDEDIQIVWNEDEGQLNIAGDSEVEEIIAHHCVGHAKDPVGELEEWHRRAEQELHPHESTVGDTNKDISADEDEDSRGSSKSSTHADVETGGALRSSQAVEADEPLMASDGAEPVLVVVENIPNVSDNNGLFRAPFMNNMSPKEEKKRLVKMGLSTTLAIILHNFPEGLATFVAALDDPPVGAALAIAIAIHNSKFSIWNLMHFAPYFFNSSQKNYDLFLKQTTTVPEGLCVALPIYYATGDRWKAFMWGCISGIAEPIAAILGWFVLASIMTDEVYAILFGLVSGMMIMISMKELIPTAHRYDPEDTVVTHTIISGMAVIALSLVLFTI